MTRPSTPQRIREALVSALPRTPGGTPPERRHVYVPHSHLAALGLEVSLVVGGRGVGKTFWSACLASEEIRTRVLARRIRQLDGVTVVQGYGEALLVDQYPDRDTFAQLLGLQGVRPYHVWRAVVLRALLARPVQEDADRRPLYGDATWEDTVQWVLNRPEALARLFEEANRTLAANEAHLLLVFDALDRTSDDWRSMDRIVRELLQVVLSLGGLERIHAKVFLRDDQFHRGGVTDFPDASKLTATRVELTWDVRDLHGLAWQYFLNAPGEHGALMRSIYEGAARRPPEDLEGVWSPLRRLGLDERHQERLFEALAGQWMGRGPRRGRTYKWVVSHLADGRRRTSPRSFLTALRAAAEDSLERYPEHEYPLHYESIKRGVQKASAIRVEELAEDYPWVKTLLEPFRGMSVPTGPEAFIQKWRETFGDRPDRALFGDRLPPEHWEEGWRGIIEDLVALGIFQKMRDGRLNMPDIYRIGFGLGRKGGVKPIFTRSSRK